MLQSHNPHEASVTEESQSSLNLHPKRNIPSQSHTQHRDKVTGNPHIQCDTKPNINNHSHTRIKLITSAHMVSHTQLHTQHWDTQSHTIVQPPLLSPVLRNILNTQSPFSPQLWTFHLRTPPDRISDHAKPHRDQHPGPVQLCSEPPPPGVEERQTRRPLGNVVQCSTGAKLGGSGLDPRQREHRTGSWSLLALLA